MTNSQHAIALLTEAKQKYDNGLDPSYQIAEAIKLCEAADRDMLMWKNKYVAAIAGMR